MGKAKGKLNVIFAFGSQRVVLAQVHLDLLRFAFPHPRSRQLGIVACSINGSVLDRVVGKGKHVAHDSFERSENTDESLCLLEQPP